MVSTQNTHQYHINDKTNKKQIVSAFKSKLIYTIRGNLVFVSSILYLVASNFCFKEARHFLSELIKLIIAQHKKRILHVIIWLKISLQNANFATGSLIICNRFSLLKW